MNERIIFKPPLFIHKDQNPLSHPQKCKIPLKNINLPAACLIKVKSKERTFLCRLYYFSEIFDDKSIAYLDDCVEVVSSEAVNSEIKYINELQIIKDPEVTFQRLRIKIFIDAQQLDLNIIKAPLDIAKVTISLLKNYSFSRDCMISISSTYGISKVHVLETDVIGHGSLTEECELDVVEIIVEKSSVNSHCNGRHLGGLEDIKSKLSSFIENNINYKKCSSNSFKPSSHCLLIGPSGSGKTTLIHHVAEKFKCNIFEISSDIFLPYPGETEQELDKIFNRIKKVTSLLKPAKPTIILIENIEIFCPKFDSKLKENSHSLRIASQIFSFLDDISIKFHGIMVIGTTSKIELVNASLRRSSRMGVEIVLDMPNEKQRYEILKVLWTSRLTTVKFDDEICTFVAESSPGFVGADFEVLCQFVARHNHQIKNPQNLFEHALRSVNPSVMRDNLGIVTRSTMKLDDIGGMDELKKTLRTSILGPLKHPENFHRFGLRSPSGILLYGPSGCAKTTLVKCLAGESKMTLISVSSAEIYSPYVGEAEKFIVRLFNQARMSAPTILFFDEIDTIVGSRSVGGGDTHMGILSTLLTEIDGFGGDASASKNKPILIIGATNRPDQIDDALMRPGRFDKLIHVPAPDPKARLQILKFLLQKMPIASDVDIESIAHRTDNFSGADLVNLCNEAAMCAATRDINCELIIREDFDDVLIFLKSSLSEEKIKFYEKFETRGNERIES